MGIPGDGPSEHNDGLQRCTSSALRLGPTEAPSWQWPFKRIVPVRFLADKRAQRERERRGLVSPSRCGASNTTAQCWCMVTVVSCSSSSSSTTNKKCLNVGGRTLLYSPRGVPVLHQVQQRCRPATLVGCGCGWARRRRSPPILSHDAHAACVLLAWLA